MESIAEWLGVGGESLLYKYVLSGGPLMWTLIPCSLLALGAILQGALRLRRGRVLAVGLRRAAADACTGAARRAFIESLSASANPLARCGWLTFKNFNPVAGRPAPYELEAVLDEAAAEVGVEMQEGLGLLATIYTIAPLLGLLGTIHGMIVTFFKFGTQQDKSVESLTIGIQYALVTTLWGLGIAIPVYVAAQWLQSKIHRYERRWLPEAVREMTQALWPEGAGAAAAADEYRDEVPGNGRAAEGGFPSDSTLVDELETRTGSRK